MIHYRRLFEGWQIILPSLINHGKGINVGGQAVIEGVMMKAPHGWSVAVRRPDGTIGIKKEPLKKRGFFSRIPMIRGCFILFDTLKLGLRALEFSAIEASSKEEKPLNSLSVAISIMIALILGVLLFILIPVYVTQISGKLFPPVLEKRFLFNLIDGILRIAIFLGYISFVRLWKDMRRVFEYHGAEHKVIHAFESNESLNIESAKKYRPEHPRCGTSFLMIVMIISILVFSIIPKEYPFLYKFLSRLILIPVIAGLSYEILRLSAGLSNTLIGRFLIMPGMLLQKLTTSEPDNNQIEVALVALKEALSFSEEIKP